MVFSSFMANKIYFIRFSKYMLLFLVFIESNISKTIKYIENNFFIVTILLNI